MSLESLNEDPKPSKPYEHSFFFRIILSKLGLEKRPRAWPLYYFFIGILLFLFRFCIDIITGDLYNGEYLTKIITGSLFMASIVLVPLGFIIMDNLYKKVSPTFKNLKSRVNADEYSDWRNNFLNSFTGKWTQPIIYIISIVGVSCVAIITWLNPEGIFLTFHHGRTFATFLLHFIPFVIIWTVITIIMLTVVWHLLLVVKGIKDFCKLKPKVLPLHPDNSGGLRPLADLAFVAASPTLLGMAAITFKVVVEGKSITHWLVLPMLIAVITLTIVLFLYPLWAPHRIMWEAKRNIMEELSEEHNQAYDTFRKELVTKKSINRETYDKIGIINTLYERAEKMPLWPFDFEIIGRLIATIVGPLLLMIGSEITLRFLFGG